MKYQKSSLLILFSVIVLDLIGFGVVIPILPFYAESYGASATILGLLLTSYAGMQFLFSPLWGKLSDKIGRKSVLILTMGGAVGGMVILGLADNLAQLFLGRIVSGIFGANISVATAYVTDVTTEENRAKGMGLIGAAFGIGFIVGPAMGGLLSVYGYSVPILVAAGLGVLNIFYAFFRLGESKPNQQTTSDTKKARVLSIPPVRNLCFLNLLYSIGLAQLEATFAFFMMDRFQYSAKEVAYILVYMALIMVTIQGGLIRRLAPRFGEKRLLKTGIVLLAMGFTLIPWSHSVAFLLIPLTLSSIGRAISQPSLLSMVSKFAPENIRGSVMGVFQSAASLARVVGPVTAGFLYDRYQGLPFYFATTLMACAFTLTWVLKKRAQARKTLSEVQAPEVDLQTP